MRLLCFITRYSLTNCNRNVPLSQNLRFHNVAAESNNKTNANIDKLHLPKERTLHVAVVGVPNAGKSTFINNLINHRVCPTSSKVHTTITPTKAISTNGDTQFIFYDTPGLVTEREVKKHKLKHSFQSGQRHAVRDSDVIAVIHDVSNSWTRHQLHSTVIDTLKSNYKVPSVLVLNKIDALKSKRVLLDLVRTLTNNTLVGTGNKMMPNNDFTTRKNDAKRQEELKKPEVSWAHFKDVFMVSSITGDGLGEIINYLSTMAKETPWEYTTDDYTDTSSEDLIVASVRARLLDYLPQEIPYNLRCFLEYYSKENNKIHAMVQVLVPSTRLERLIRGEADGRLRQITERVTSDLVETFRLPISLTIATKAKNQQNK